jgi:HK97 family phage major capsid protein
MNYDIELKKIENKIQNLQNSDYLTQYKKDKKEKELRNQQIDLAMAIQKRNNKKTNSQCFADMSKAMIEKRSIVSNGIGAINQIKEIVKELSTKKEIISMVRIIYGDNAEFGIPVLSPTIARPESYNEGENNIPVDTNAKIDNKIIYPIPYISLLPVSAESLSLNSINIEKELIDIFVDAYGDELTKSIIQGNDGFDGIFNNNIENKIETDFDIKDLAKLALTLNDYNGDSIILMNETIYNKFLFNVNKDDKVAMIYAKILKDEKKIEGIEIHTTGYAPFSTTTGSIVAVGFRPEDYILALAGQIHLEIIKKVGDTNTYYQATLFCGGTKTINKNFFGLVVE